MDFFGIGKSEELEKAYAEIERLRQCIDNMLEELNKERAKLSHAELIEKENERLKDRLSMFTTAREKGCERGEYCRACAYGVLVDYAHGQKCVCAYGECAHFRKDG